MTAALDRLAYGSGAVMALFVATIAAVLAWGWWKRTERYQNTTEIAEAEQAAKEASDA